MTKSKVVIQVKRLGTVKLLDLTEGMDEGKAKKTSYLRWPTRNI